MGGLYRKVMTSFWREMDKYTPEDKYFYLYLLTNDSTSLSGVYQISIKRMAFELGYDTETVEKLIERFVEYGKIGYSREYCELIVYNWYKTHYTKNKDSQAAISTELAQHVKTPEFRYFAWTHMTEIPWPEENTPTGDPQGGHRVPTGGPEGKSDNTPGTPAVVSISNSNSISNSTSGDEKQTDPDPAADEPQPPAKRKSRKKELAPEDRELYHTLESGFLKKNGGQFTSWKKEGEAIKGLIAKARARAPDYPEDYIKAAARKFWELKSTDTSARGFWRGQPFTPSTLNSDTIFDRVMEQFRDAEVDEDLKEYYRERGINLETGEFLEVG